MKKKRNWRGVSDKVAKDKMTIYNSKEWQELRIAKLRSTDGLCEECMKDGIIKSANIVHHKHPIEESHSMQEMRHWAFMWENLMSVCQSCHARIHRDQLKSNTKDVVKQRSEARQERWVDNLMSKFVKQEDNEGIQHQQTDIVPPQGER